MILKSLAIFVVLATQVTVYTTPNINNNKNEVPRESLQNYWTIENTNGSRYTAVVSNNRVPARKWQVGRVSRKHYEIVNMLWRKTKLFDDLESTTKSIFLHESTQTLTSKTPYKIFSSLSSKYHLSTPSYIEFYYLDDNDDRFKRTDSLSGQKHVNNVSDQNILRINSLNPVLSFRINDKTTNTKMRTSVTRQSTEKRPEKSNRRGKSYRQSHPLYDFLLSQLESKVANKRKFKPLSSKNRALENNSERYVNHDTCPSTVHTAVSNSSLDDSNTENNHSSSKTTPYDKIKFFEIHDKATYDPRHVNQYEVLFDHNLFDPSNRVKEDYVYRNQRIQLEDINKNLGHHDGLNQKFVKKHVDEVFTNDIVNNKTLNKHKLKTLFHQNKTNHSNGIEQYLHKHNFFNQHNAMNISRIIRNSSKLASWSDYPFAAIYVYETSQIHCDSAALSPHWLIAAGSCLSRFHGKDTMTGRSAYVVYCSENWWEPQRVSYVKYSIVHPRYHPKDKIRRNVYNLGLIQVVGSMSSCFGWAPISLMSHDFVADVGGSTAITVGWGLDRYDMQYALSELPKKQLSVYESIIFSNSCPGNIGYSKMKSKNGDATKNIYCLLLPDYYGEENDPVHGSMLLAGGKLIALYKEEQRRAFGVQSAQYTSIWRLVPWIHDIAKEPEDDLFTFDI